MLAASKCLGDRTGDILIFDRGLRRAFGFSVVEFNT